MASRVIDKRWIVQQKFVSGISGYCGKNIACAKLNDHEFILAQETHSKYEDEKDKDGYRGIHKYNTHSNKWTKLIQYPDDINISEHAIAIDTAKYKLYIMSVLNYAATIYEFDLQKNAFIQEIKVDAGYNNGFVLENESVHVLDSSAHKSWNICKSSTWKNVTQQGRSYKFSRASYGVCGIYVPSKNVILFISGFESAGPSYLGIRRFNLDTATWETVVNGFEFPKRCCKATLTFDEDFVIIAVGYDSDISINRRSDKLFVLDMRGGGNWTLKECNITCPNSKFADVIAMRSGERDGMLVV
eukprot:137460_1